MSPARIRAAPSRSTVFYANVDGHRLIGCNFSTNATASTGGTLPATQQVSCFPLAGNLGSVVTSTVAAAALAATTTWGNIASIAVTPGIWTFSAHVSAFGGATGFTASNLFQMSITAASAVAGTTGLNQINTTVYTLVAGGYQQAVIPSYTVTVPAAGNYYLNINAVYGGGSPTAYATLTGMRTG
jgi:hypothetical protein